MHYAPHWRTRSGGIFLVQCNTLLLAVRCSPHFSISHERAPTKRSSFLELILCSPIYRNTMEEAQLRDFPPVADVETDIFRPLPVVNVIPAEASNDGTEAICIGILSAFSEALEGSNSTRLEDLFLGDGAYWRDTLAFTYHLRTFAGRGAIAGAFRELHPQRRGSVLEIMPCTAKPVSAGPSLVSKSHSCRLYSFLSIII